MIPRHSPLTRRHSPLASLLPSLLATCHSQRLHHGLSHSAGCGAPLRRRVRRCVAAARGRPHRPRRPGPPARPRAAASWRRQGRAGGGVAGRGGGRGSVRRPRGGCLPALGFRHRAQPLAPHLAERPRLTRPSARRRRRRRFGRRRLCRRRIRRRRRRAPPRAHARRRRRRLARGCCRSVRGGRRRPRSERRRRGWRQRMLRPAARAAAAEQRRGRPCESAPAGSRIVPLTRRFLFVSG